MRYVTWGLIWIGGAVTLVPNSAWAGHSFADLRTRTVNYLERMGGTTTLHEFVDRLIFPRKIRSAAQREGYRPECVTTRRLHYPDGNTRCFVQTTDGLALELYGKPAEEHIIRGYRIPQGRGTAWAMSIERPRDKGTTHALAGVMHANGDWVVVSQKLWRKLPFHALIAGHGTDQLNPPLVVLESVAHHRGKRDGRPVYGIEIASLDKVPPQHPVAANPFSYEKGPTLFELWPSILVPHPAQRIDRQMLQRGFATMNHTGTRTAEIQQLLREQPSARLRVRSAEEAAAATRAVADR